MLDDDHRSIALALNIIIPSALELLFYSGLLGQDVVGCQGMDYAEPPRGICFGVCGLGRGCSPSAMWLELFRRAVQLDGLLCKVELRALGLLRMKGSQRSGSPLLQLPYEALVFCTHLGLS